MSSDARMNIDEVIEETGLNLFDDRASAAGGFPNTMLGYDRHEVDRYVRELEMEVSTLKQLARHLRRELISARDVAGAETDFTRLGTHATGILRAAEAQASDLVSKAGVEAERIKEEGRRVAADLRANAQAEADDIRVAGLANLRKLRADLDADSHAMLQQSKIEASSSLEAAQRQAATILAEAEKNAAGIIEQSTLEAARVRQQGERLGAETLAAARAQAEEVLTTAQTEHLEAKDRAAQMLADATRHQGEARDQVGLEGDRARDIRAAALLDAEQIKVTASRDAESQMANAHRHVAMMKDRLEEQYAWRKEQLEREVAALLQRKQSVIAQMSNLRELAGESALDFPDADPFSNRQPIAGTPGMAARTPDASTTTSDDDYDYEPTVTVNAQDVSGDSDLSETAVRPKSAHLSEDQVRSDETEQSDEDELPEDTVVLNAHPDQDS